MAGTLTISTLSDGTNSTSSTNAIMGSAKAWVNFNGTTSPGTIRGSFNVSSVTKIGTGSFTANFTNAMPDANYSAVGSTFDSGVVCMGTRATGSIGIITRLIQGASGTANDYDQVYAAVFR